MSVVFSFSDTTNVESHFGHPELKNPVFKYDASFSFQQMVRFFDPKERCRCATFGWAEFGRDEILKIIPARSPINGSWFVTTMDEKLVRQIVNPNERQIKI
jgi:hypothetical protein